jgi:hypothetical protein
VIGRALRRERGALALRRTASGFSIDSARSPNFDRPWSPHQARVTAAVPSGTAGSTPAASTSTPRDATPRPEDIEADN